MRKGWTSLCIVLILAMITSASTQAASAPSKVLSDISTHWAKSAIEQAVSKGYVDGYPNHTFKPNNQVTRAEFVKMLSEALHLQLPTTNAKGKWYAPYAQALKDAALLRDGDLAADWSKPLPRLEMAKLLVRGSDDSVRNKSLSDGEWLYRATSKGLITGMDDGTLNETGPTTRAQAVTVIERLFMVRNGGTLPVDKAALDWAAIMWKGSNAEEQGFAKPIKLPAKFDVGLQVDLTLDKMIVIDMDNPKAPYRKALGKYELINRNDNSSALSGEYVVALHFVMKNKRILSTGMGGLFDLFELESGTGFEDVYFSSDTPKSDRDNFPLLYPKTLLYDKAMSSEGWLLMGIRKDILKTSPFGNQIMGFNMKTQTRIYLTQHE